MSEEPKLPHYAKRALERLKAGRTLCRTSSDTDEAVIKGGGFIWFTEPDHKPFPPASAVLLLKEGYLTPQNDGLLAGISQTFTVAENAA